MGRPVAGSRLDVTYPRAHEPLVALLTDTMVAELVAADLWQRRRGVPEQAFMRLLATNTT